MYTLHQNIIRSQKHIAISRGSDLVLINIMICLMLRIKLTSKYRTAHRSKFCGALSLRILFPTLYILDVKAYMRSTENAYQPVHRNWSSVSVSSHIPSTFPVNRRREATLDIKFTRECWP